MKKLILLILLLPSLCIAGSIQDAHKAVIARLNVSTATDYTAHANCMFAAFMNGGLSANGDSETDRSGENNNLTETSGDIPNDAGVPAGYSGSSRAFVAGDSEYLAHADNLATDINGVDQKISFGAWVKISAIANAELRAILGKYDYGDNNRQYAILCFGTDTNEFSIRAYISKDGTSGADTVMVESTTTNYAVGSWMHVAAVYDDIDLRVYVNGVLHSTPGAWTTGIFNGNQEFRVGAADNSGALAWWFPGLIDEPFVFNTDLSDTQILEIKTYGIDGSKGGND